MPTTLSPPRFWKPQEIEAAAADFRRRADWAAIPVDVIVVSRRLGIPVALVEFEDVSVVGSISRSESGWTIWASKKGPPERVFFTIAHELGHYAMHLSGQDGGEFVDTDATLYRQSAPAGDRDDRAREVQANMFAASLLMPEAAVRCRWHEGVLVRRLAKQFDVSETAMRYRIEQLGLWDDA